MAMISHRLRRALVTAASCVNRSISLSPASVAPTADFPSVSTVLGGLKEATRAPARLFRTWEYDSDSVFEITENEVIFGGCDFKHWLITMDFPKDNPLSPKEMVSIYEKTCAAGLGISLEQAKEKIYACSTTTYQGFQAEMNEEDAAKFKDLPGVMYVLPDSYIDPVNCEYGGDKYENGVITRRPPPSQLIRRSRHSRNRQGRVGGGGPQNFQTNTQFGQQPPPMQGDTGAYGGPPRYPPPPYQAGYDQGGGPQNFQTNTQFGQQPPPMQGGTGAYGGPPRYPPPPYQAGYDQGQGSPVPPYQGQGRPGNYSQGPQGRYNQRGPRNYSLQGNGNYVPPPGAENPNPGFGQGYAGPGQEQTQTFPHADQRNVAGDWNNNNPAGQPFPQGRRY